ncbi:MAG TPA: FeoA family protein [Syntrophomonadaceae bacterium]|nr:FeoA family protein [Syntrophomonadaceae bacterium]
MDIPLTKLPVNKYGLVRAIKNQGASRHRLLDLGFVPGTEVQTVRKSPAGNPIAYLIRGTVIALRNDDTDLVIVSVVK